MSVTAFTITVLLAYLIGLKVVGYLAYKYSSETTEDYFLAKRDVGFFLLVATTMASIFSTGTVVSSPSQFFTQGAGYLWVFAFMGLPLAMMPFVLKFWKLGQVKQFITPGDLLGDFYKNNAVRVTAGIIGAVAMIPYATAQLVAVGKTFEALTAGAIHYPLGVSIISLAIGLYLYFGGSRAVIWTDAIQGVTFSLLIIISGFLVVQWAGGWTPMIDTLLREKPSNLDFQLESGYFELFLPCLTFFFLPYVWQRMYMARTAQAVAFTVMIFPVIIGLLFFITWVIGTGALSLFPSGLPDGDAVLGAIFRERAPYFGAFVLVAAFCAGMSTVDSQLLSTGSIFTNDFRLRSRAQRIPLKEYAFGRRATLSLLLFSFTWSLFLYEQSILDLILIGISFNVVLAPAVIGLFYWKRSTSLGAFWSIVIGAGIYLLKYFTPLGAYFPTDMGAVLWATLSSFVVFIFVSLLTDAEALREKREEYQRILL